jgi:antitoxin CcdA
MRIDRAHSPRKGIHRRPVLDRSRRKPLEVHRPAFLKRATNLSVRSDLIEAARAARVNMSALLERALEEELVRLKWRQWREENAASIAAYNRHVKDHGAFVQIWQRW